MPLFRRGLQYSIHPSRLVSFKTPVLHGIKHWLIQNQGQNASILASTALVYCRVLYV